MAVDYIRVPVAEREGSNVRELYGPSAAVQQFLFSLPVATCAAVPARARGRKPGSTNWTRERFWRRYRMAARNLARPYRRTHLAVRIGLSYDTFVHYLTLWGPPEGVSAPGE